MRQASTGLAVLALMIAAVAGSSRDLQQVALPSAFPGADSGDAGTPPATPATPAAATPASPAAATTTPSPPATAPAAAPTPGPAASVSPAAGPAASTPSGAPAPAPSAGAGTPAPSGAAIATGGGDMMAPGMAPAPAPGLAPGLSNVIYMQQSGNAQLITTPGNTNSGTLSMNNALDTTLFDADYPFRKIGKASTNNFLNAANNGTQWFSPPPQGILLGFNTSANVFLLLTLSAPVYNFTTNTVGFNFNLTNASSLQAGSPANGFLTNYYLTNPTDSDTQPLRALLPGPTTLFTPTLFYTIPCATTEGPVAPGSCTLSRSGVCAGAQHASWKNATFCG